MTDYEKMTKAEVIEELKKKERLSSLAHELVSSSDDAIIGKYLDGTIILWNRGAENVYGYSAGEIIGQNITILSHPDHHQEILQILEKISRGERIQHFETVRVTKEGRQIHVSLNICPIKNSAGEITGGSTIARDITDPVQMEQKLAKIASFPMLIPHPVMEVDLDGRVSFVNPAARQLFPDIVQRGSDHPWLVDWQSLVAPCRDGGKNPDDREVTVAGRWYHQTMYYVPEEQRLRIYGFDITKRNRIENIMQARLRLLEFSSSHSLDELLTATLDEIEALTGSSIGFYHFLEPDQKTLLLQNWSTNTLKNMCTATGKGSHYAIDRAGVWVQCVHERRPVIHNDYASLPHRKGMPEGHATVVREAVVPISRGNLIRAIIGVGNKATDYDKDDIETVLQLGDLSLDITERKLMEEELRRAHDDLEKRVAERTEQLEQTAETLRSSEERYAVAVQGSNDGIWDLNVITGEAYHSPRWKRILGYEDHELSDNFTEWESRIHPDDYRTVIEAFKSYLEGRLPVWETEHRLRHKDGSYRWVLSRGACLRDAQGKPYRMAGSLTDITERKKLEQQLLQAQKMETVGILAGGVAHDFNNLLTAISGYGQILQERIPEDDELGQESITNVLNAADRAAELTRGLLAFSRKQVISLKPVHIDPLIRNTGKLIKRIIGEDIEFSTRFSGENLRVKADPGQMEQVLMNLATNAHDAMPLGGNLSIATRRVIVKKGSETLYDLPSPGAYVLISVADTGTGIDQRALDSIFEPFYTTKEIGKGTGLGLAIVHGIIKQHNGSILASSEPGKGTIFNIYLPLIKDHVDREAAKISAQAVGGKETVLLAEDEEMVKTFVKNILERAGYKVIIAENGEDAVARFREHDDISLVLSDVVMPRKNGKDMLDELRRIKPNVKVVFISGYPSDIMVKKGMFEDTMEFITKPFRKEELLQKVREVLDKN